MNINEIWKLSMRVIDKNSTKRQVYLIEAVRCWFKPALETLLLSRVNTHELKEILTRLLDITVNKEPSNLSLSSALRKDADLVRDTSKDMSLMVQRKYKLIMNMAKSSEEKTRLAQLWILIGMSILKRRSLGNNQIKSILDMYVQEINGKIQSKFKSK